MTNISGWTSFRFTLEISAGLTPGTYALPVSAYDALGNLGTANIYLKVNAGAFVTYIVYDGETPDTDANWQLWSGKGTFYDQNTNVFDGISGIFEVQTNDWTIGIDVPYSDMWNTPWDISTADSFEFFYKGDAAILNLFSYDPINGIIASRDINLPASGVWARFSTNISYFTQGQAVKMNLKKFVGIQLRGAIAGASATYLDNMWFTRMILVTGQANPSFITNTHTNAVQFQAVVKSAVAQITNVEIDLSLIGGPSNARMSNILNSTLWQYTFTVASNRAMGNYRLLIQGLDDQGYTGNGNAYLNITGPSLFDVLIVYDGDNIPVNPQQWWPAPPPSTAQFVDIDGTETLPHSGVLAGMYFQTNLGSTIFHRRDPAWNGLDVSSSDVLEIWAKGRDGNEDITLEFHFLNISNIMQTSSSTNLSLDKEWMRWTIDTAILTQGNNGLLTKFIGMTITEMDMYDFVYFDDIRFAKYILIKDEKGDPVNFDPERDTTVEFTCKAFSALNNITAVTLDLTQVGGGKVGMTNLSGWTSFRYSFTILSNYNVGTGPKLCPIVAVDDGGHAAYSRILLRGINPYETILWDFEDGTAGQEYYPPACPSCPSTFQRGGWDIMNTNSLLPDGECSALSMNVATNLNVVGIARHGVQSLGWDWKLDVKETAIQDNRYQAFGSTMAWYYGVVNGTVCSRGGGGAGIQGKFDMSAYRGFYWHAYVEPQDTIDVEEPIYMRVMFRCQGWGGGACGSWYEGPFVHVIPGRWVKGWIDFDDCYGYTDCKHFNIPLADRQNVIDIENISLTGAYSASGTTKVYLDYIVAMDYFAPGAPDGLNDSDPGTGGTLSLNWNPTGDVDVERYHIYQAKVNDTNQAILVGSTTSNYSIDKGVWNNRLYYYWVSAVDRSENEGQKSAVASGMATGMMPTVTYPYKGVTLSANPGELPGNLITELSNMKKNGVNTVGVVVTWSNNGDNMYSNANLTLPDYDLAYIITNIHNMGMKVMLQPKLINSTNTAIYKFSASVPGTWFGNYDGFITKYATIASQYNVELFVVGSDLNNMTTNGYSGNWNSIIANVVNIYTNDLTYSARWGPDKGVVTWGNALPWHRDMPTYRHICLWDNPNIDYIGIDAYYRLSYLPNPPLSVLYWQWDHHIITNNMGNSSGDPPHELEMPFLLMEWFRNIRDWREQKYPGKDIIFTEIGYASQDFAANKPWLEDLASSSANNNLQKDCYEAAFRRIWDQSWMQGTFWYGFKPTEPAAGNKFFTPQGKPAYTVIDWWYNPKPHHFAIIHDGGGEAMYWEPVVIEVHQVDHSLVTTYTGTITLDISQGTPGSISWTNYSGCGQLVDWGTGTARATYKFGGLCDAGVVTIWVKDNAMETVNFDVRAGSLVESTNSDAEIIFTGPLSHFEVIHDGYALVGLPEIITIQAIDVFNNVKIDYNGTVTLYAAWASGNIKWTNDVTNINYTNLGGGKIVVEFVETGFMKFMIIDDVAESVDIEAKDTEGFQDNDFFDPLRFIEFDHFAVYHDGAAIVSWDEPLAIVAEDAANNPVYGVSGAITISFDTNVTGPVFGAISLSLIKGAGTFSALGNNRWIYNMVPSDGGIVSLMIKDSAGDQVDIEADMLGFSDNDRAPQILTFANLIYHYVRKNNPSPVPPYVFPADAATNIWDAITVAADNHIVLIIDDETYPPLRFLEATPMDYLTIAAHFTNNPTIAGDGSQGPAVVLDEGGCGEISHHITFKNLRFFGNNESAVVMGRFGQASGYVPIYINFINCVFTNTGGSHLLDTEGNAACLDGLGRVFQTIKDCTFIGSGGGSAVDAGVVPDLKFVGNRIYNVNSVGVGCSGSGSQLSGNIIYDTLAAPFISAADNAYHNTVFDCGGNVNNLNNVYNNIFGSNTQNGIDSGTGNYNNAFDNFTANFGPNYNGGSPAPNDIISNAYFTNSAIGDFRLLPNSASYNSAQPNSGIQACRGAHPAGVRLAMQAPGAVTTYTLTFVPMGDIPVDGEILLTFPTGFDISGVSSVTSTSPWGGIFNHSANGQVLVISRGGGGIPAPAWDAQNLIIDGVGNTTTGGVFSLVMEVRKSSSKLEGYSIDHPRETSCFSIIVPPAPCNLSNHSPAINESGVSLTSKITCIFNTNINAASLSSNTFYLQDSDWKYVPATFTIQGKTVLLEPVNPLQPNEFYTVTLTTNVENIFGSKLSAFTQWHFYTAPGYNTVHEYNTISLDANLSDWDSANNVTYNTSHFEPLALDAVDTLWGHTKEIYATWDTNYLYIAIRKATNSSLEWFDYIAIDITRDDIGATNNPGALNPFNYDNNRKPEFLLWFDHDEIFSPTYNTNNWRLYDWDGNVWDFIRIANSDRGDDGNKIVEVRLPWSMFGEVPNRIAIGAYVFSGGVVYDYCPENISGPLNWITIDPDNNDNEIPDFIFVPRPDHFHISHDGTAIITIPERIEITVRNANNTTFSNYTVTITLDIIMGDSSQISFANYSGNGTFTDLGGGKAVYQWAASDNGVITLFITDNVTDNVNVRIKSDDGLLDDDLEGNIVFTAPALLSISKTGTPYPVNVGNIITYRIRITNESSFYAYDVKIEDTEPFGTTYIPGSLRTGGSGSTYASATPVSDASGDDEGSFDGSKITFCGPEVGIAPGQSGALAGNSVWVVYFQAQVNSDNTTVEAKTVSITNKEDAFDGYINSDGDVSNSGYLRVGDTGDEISASIIITQFANDRDHSVRSKEDGSYTGFEEPAFTIGDYNSGNPNPASEHIAYLTFSLGSIPSGGVITSATLYLKMAGTNGNPKWPLHIDHVEYSNIFDTATDLANRYNCVGSGRQVLSSSFRTIPAGTLTVGAYYGIGCKDQIQYSLSNPVSWTENGSSQVVQIRIRDNDGLISWPHNYVEFDSHSQGAGNYPYMKVDYRVSDGKQIRAFTGFNLVAIPANASSAST